MATFTDKNGLPTLTEGSLTGHDIVQTINAYNTAMIEIIDRLFTNQATLQTYPLKSVIVTEEVYNNKIFRGEIQDMRTTNQHVTYNATDKARKLLKQQADYNAIIHSGYFRQLMFDGTSTYKLLDDDKSFGGASELVGHLVHFNRTTKDRIRISPNDSSSSDPSLVDYKDGTFSITKDTTGTDESAKITTSGDQRQTYRGIPDNIDDPAEDSYVRWKGYTTSGQTLGAFMAEFTIYFSVRSSVSIDEILSVEVEGSWKVLSDFNLSDSYITDPDDPFIGLWDFVASDNEYVGDYVNSEDVGGRFIGIEDTDFTESNVTPFTIKKITSDTVSQFADTPTDFISTVTTEGNYTLYRMRVGVGSGQDGFERVYTKLRSIIVEVKLSGDQLADKGVEVIASHTDTEITFGNLGVDGTPPLIDGCARDDIYIITDTLDDQINALETAWGITINADITNSDKLALTQDFTFSTRRDVLQAIADLGNAAWWYNPVDDDYNIVSADKLDGSVATYRSGITLTKDDIENYQQSGAWDYTIDPSNIADTLILKGSDQIGVVELSLSPDFSHTLGDEQVVIVKSEINSQYQASKFLDAERHKWEKARRTFTCTIDLDTPSQSYADLAIGQTVAVQLPSSSDTSVCDHTTTGDGELLITQLQWTKKPGSGNRNKVTITAERRYS